MRASTSAKARPGSKKAKPVAKKPPPKAAKKAAQPRREAARIAGIIAGLEALYPDAHCELDYHNHFQLFVAVILSAQCTDVRVNQVTPVLFARYPDAAALADADPAEVEQIIKPTGFFRNKTKSIIGCAQALVDDFGGQVPRTMDQLLTLPGVARKTANVVLGTAYGINHGFVVDTHIGRLARRLHLSTEEDPVKVERDLCASLPQDQWTQLGHQIIWHGRRVCAARKPACAECALAPFCPSAGVAGA